MRSVRGAGAALVSVLELDASGVRVLDVSAGAVLFSVEAGSVRVLEVV